MKKSQGWIFVLLGVLGVSGCGKSSSSEIDPSVTVEPTFSSISKNILTPGCVGCHGSSGGYSFESYTETKKAVGATPATSELYTSLANGSMPQSGTKPSAQQIQAIADWITAGANND